MDKIDIVFPKEKRYNIIYIIYEKNKKYENTNISRITNVRFVINKNENIKNIIENLGERKERKLSFSYKEKSEDKHSKKEICNSK